MEVDQALRTTAGSRNPQLHRSSLDEAPHDARDYRHQDGGGGEQVRLIRRVGWTPGALRDPPSTLDALGQLGWFELGVGRDRHRGRGGHSNLEAWLSCHG